MKLTVEEAKGLEFRDVVMFNFFNPKHRKKWSVLKYLKVHSKQGNRDFHLQ